MQSKAARPVSTTPRFLVVQLADIGDLVLSLPALAALRDAHPDAHIAVLTTAHAAPILMQHPAVDDVIMFDKHTFDSPKALLRPANLRRAAALAARLRRGRYETTLIFHHFSTRFGALKFAALAWSAGSRRVIGLENGSGFFLTERLPDAGFGARHQAQYWLDLAALAGADAAPRPAKLYPTDADRDWADSVLPADTADSHPLIAIHAGSGGYSHARRWDAAHFAVVADALIAEYSAEVIFVGGPDDDTAAVIEAMQQRPLADLSGKTTLTQLAALLARCDLLIGADSGVMHIAAAADTPVVAIFGPSNHQAWSPWLPDERRAVVRSAPACSPCSYVGFGVGLREGCAARTCMRMVTPPQVIAAAVSLVGLHKSSSDNLSNSHLAPRPSSQITRHSPPTITPILGIPVAAVTYEDWLRLIDAWIADEVDPRCRQVCTVNPEFIMTAQRDVNFRNILQRAALCVPDGVGLLWAARRRGQPLPQRVTGSDGVPLIAAEAARRGWRIFLLGAAPGVADAAAAKLTGAHPGLQIVGTHSGSPAADEEDAIVAMINTSGAQIVFVAYGAPEQDKWIARNLPRLRARMAMGVGGSLDFVAGVVPRAPDWMQRAGLEWLYRLLRQPWRIRRMMRLPLFVLAALREETAMKRK